MLEAVLELGAAAERLEVGGAQIGAVFDEIEAVLGEEGRDVRACDA